MTEREIRKFIEMLGGRVTSIKVGKHWKVQTVFQSTSLQLTFPLSESDWRALRNQESFIRRKLREANDNKKPPHKEAARG